ncbi:MAG: MBL fold metallo-hydrolase [Vampirovibrio sp.]|nr:MBL fold metallo-hydrolase [Vampirovibrio sp.]
MSEQQTEQSIPTHNLTVDTFPVGPLQCNCTIIGDPTTKQAIVVDPGGDSQVILDRLAAQEYTVDRILHTHAHFDHFLASGEMKKATGAPLALHKEDKPLWDNLEMQCNRFSIPFTPVPAPDQWIDHEEELSLNHTCCGQALHTPGHTPGSTSFYFENLKLLIAGDTLFKGAIGRTDLWGGDFPTIEHSIKTHLYTLDETATVITGHGPATVLGDEMRSNPFVQA